MYNSKHIDIWSYITANESAPCPYLRIQFYEYISLEDKTVAFHLYPLSV